MRPLFKKIREGEPKTQAIFGYSIVTVPDWGNTGEKITGSFKWIRLVFSFTSKSWLEFDIFIHSDKIYENPTIHRR